MLHWFACGLLIGRSFLRIPPASRQSDEAQRQLCCYHGAEQKQACMHQEQNAACAPEASSILQILSLNAFKINLLLSTNAIHIQ